MVDDETLPDVSLRPLPGSERAAAPEARRSVTPARRHPRAGHPGAGRRGAPDDSDLEQVALAGGLTPDALAAGYGAAPQNVELVTTTLAGLGVEVVSVDAPSRRGAGLGVGCSAGTGVRDHPGRGHQPRSHR